MRSVLTKMQPILSEPLPIVVATKGIEEDTLKLMSQVLNELLPATWAPGITILTGPSFAKEVCQSKPTTILLAGQDSTLLAKLQTVFKTSFFRVYTSSDMIGAQLGGALKNVMAIAAGVVDGLNLGANARAALITRGLAEIIRLGSALGADVHTFYGLSGLGDLFATCVSSHSRNWKLGYSIGSGKSVDQFKKETGYTVEGVEATRIVNMISERDNISMPITNMTNKVINQEYDPETAIKEFMTRDLSRERN